MKKQLSFFDYIKLEKTWHGFVWLVSGSLGFLGGFIYLISTLTALILCILILMRTLMAKKESPDEMAERNINRAKARAMDYMQLACLVLVLVGVAVFSLFDIHLNITPSMLLLNATFILMGMNDLLVGILFKKYEDE